VTHFGVGAGTLRVGGGAEAIASVNPAATVEKKVEFLLQRDQEQQRTMNTSVRRIATLETDSPRQLAELRAEIVEHLDHELAATAEEYRPARILGLIFVFVGLALGTLGNVVA